VNLHRLREERESAGAPMWELISGSLIGAGKFGSMFLAQAPRMPGLHVAGIADLAPARAALEMESAFSAKPAAGVSAMEHRGG
jgi:predicted homoserine dehydrogenase-like protein